MSKPIFLELPPPQTTFNPAPGLLDCESIRSIELVLDLSAPRDRINGDERQLRQALINLLMNALEAMSPRGRLTVTSGTVEMHGAPHLRLTISDTGTGIEKENLQNIFGRFKRFHADDGSSYGLGLPIVKTIADFHGILVEVNSVKGVGSTFSIVFP